jgi:hypothetical protein
LARAEEIVLEDGEELSAIRRCKASKGDYPEKKNKSALPLSYQELLCFEPQLHMEDRQTLAQFTMKPGGSVWV